MTEPMDMERIERYFAGELGEDDVAQLRRWLMGHPEAARVLDCVARELDGVNGLGEIGLPDARVSWQSLAARMSGNARASTLTDVVLPQREHPVVASRKYAVGRTSRFTRRRLRLLEGQPWRRAGLYLGIGLVVGILGIVVGRNEYSFLGLVSGKAAVSRYATTSGERANVTLPDGSTVMLNVASQLDVPADYAAGNHTVRLKGEALFTVTHHAGTPFMVIADATTARVLGTSFMVRHYPTDTMAIVAVQEGKVAVDNVIVTASRLVEVPPHGPMRLRTADASQFGFATGVLTLDSMPLPQAIVELDRWYAADIRLGSPSLARVAIEGNFSAGSLSDLTSVLELMLNARVVRDGRVLTLFPKVR